jgi:hypothetical protein
MILVIDLAVDIATVHCLIGPLCDRDRGRHSR